MNSWVSHLSSTISHRVEEEKQNIWNIFCFENSESRRLAGAAFEKRKYIPAVTHIDGTGRVQTVTKKINPDFYHLIEKFYEISKVPMLLNTSFNENEPIVMTIDNAIECFLRTNMDILVLNNFIIKR